MLIKRIKIENFGTLSDRTFEFTAGYNEQIRDNGWGKSTLASFIRVMFYGFKNENKRSKLEKEREIVRPWQGGTYGGSILFEYNGKEYLLSRTFGNKASEDTFSLKDNETKFDTGEFSERIGEELFRIDEEAFVRTVYIAQNDISTGPTDSIHAKISNLTEFTDDIANYETVDGKLKDALNRISKKGTGEIPRISERILETEQEIRSGGGIDHSIEQLEESISRNRREAAAIGEQQKKLQSEQAAAAREDALVGKRERYDQAVNERQVRNQVLIDQKALFPLGIPDITALEDNIFLAGRLERKYEAVTKAEPSGKEKAVLHDRGTVFADGVPSETDIETKLLAVGEIARKQSEYSRLQFSEEEQAAYDMLEPVFGDKGNVSVKADELIEDWNSRNKKSGTIELRKASLETKKQLEADSKLQHSKDNKLWTVILLSGVAAAIAGVAVMVFLRYTVFGLIAAAAGIALIAAGFIMRSRRQVIMETLPEEEPAWKKLEKEILEDIDIISDTDARARAFFAEYGLSFDEDSVLNDLYTIKARYDRFAALTDKKNDSRDDLLLKEINKLTKDVEEFLAPFADLFTAAEDLQGRLMILRSEASDYTEAGKAYETYLGLKREYEEAEVPLQAFIAGLGILRNPDESSRLYLTRIRNMVDNLNKARDEFIEADNRVKRMEAEPDHPEYRSAVRSRNPMPREEFDARISELTEKQNDLTQQYADYKGELDDQREKKDALDETAVNLVDLRERRTELLRRQELLTKTRKYLSAAKDRFTRQYTAPVTEAYIKYYKMLDVTDGPEYEFKADSTMLITDHGAERHITSYSSGSQDKINLCFRMALIDTMFTGEKPMLIMDDPFTNLDDTRLEAAKKMILEIAGSYQILYFTCHESRKCL